MKAALFILTFRTNDSGWCFQQLLMNTIRPETTPGTTVSTVEGQGGWPRSTYFDYENLQSLSFVGKFSREIDMAPCQQFVPLIHTIEDTATEGPAWRLGSIQTASYVPGQLRIDYIPLRGENFSSQYDRQSERMWWTIL
ncbi:hypothetical protein BT69DRAFT_544413 [Atractiella rhizophila]|nr:hypothetical protein BT69DRAFT_544413 [Atractiella rhizophila]